MAETSTSNYKIGDRVVATASELNGHMGTIKFIGQVAGTKGTWYGIELDNPVGRHDGSHKSVKYFECKQQHGVFLKENSFIPVELDLPTPVMEEQNVHSENIASDEITQEEKTSPLEEKASSQEERIPSQEEKVEKVEEEKAPQEEEAAKEEPEAEIEPPEPQTKTTVSSISEKVPEKPAKEDKKQTLPSKDPSSKTVITKPTTSKITSKTTSNKTEPKTTAPTTTTVGKKPGVKPGATTTKPPTTKATAPTTSASSTVTGTSTTGTLGSPIIAEQSAQIQELQKEIENLNQEIKGLVADVESKNEQIEELISRNGELVDKVEDMSDAFRKEKEELQNKLAEVQSVKADELKKLDELDSEYKKKFRETHNQLQEALKEKKELDFQVKRLQRELETSQNSETMIENLILEKDTLAERAELAELELEEAKNKIKQLEEEKELQQLEAEEALLAQGGSDVGELRLENMKLKQALEKLFAKYESEKKEAENKINDLTKRTESLPKLEEKDKQIKQLNEELKKKQLVIEDLQYLVDDASDSARMVETLTEDLLKKDDEIIELRREAMHLKRDLETDEQLIDEQDEYLKELEKDVMVRDVEISNLKVKLEEQAMAQGESEKVLQKFKEKVKTLKEEVQLLRQKASGGDEKRLFDKIDELSHKQIELVTQIRENHKKQISAELEKIRATNENLKYSVLLSVLPKNLKDKLHVESLSKFIQIVLLKDKVNLLVKEIKGKYMKDDYYSHENIEFISWLKTLLLDLADIVFYCDILELKFYSFDNEDEIDNYVLFTKSNIFNQLLAINSLVEQIFNNIKEDTLSIKFNLDTLRLVIEKLTNSCQEYEEQFAILPLKLKKIVDQTISQSYELYAYGLNKQKKLHKIEKVISRLEDFNLKFHKNLIQSDGEVEDKHETNLETMISLKYSLESFCEKIKGAEALVDNEIEELELESEQECSKLSNYQSINEDEHIALTLKGPWNQINNNLRNEIEQVSETAIAFEKANSQLKEQIKANLQQQNEIKDINNIKAALEKRVSDLQLKSEKVVMLEMEKKRFLEKEVHFKEATEKIRQTLENAEKRVRLLEEENARLKLNVGPETPANKFKGRITTASSQGGSSRNLVPSFDEGLARDGATHSDVEEYLNIISKLEEENISAKSEEFKKRVRDLHDTMPEFAKCMERFGVNNLQKSASDAVSDEEKAKLGQIISRVAGVGKRTKLEICQSSIISLKDFSNKSKFEKQEFVENYIKNKSEDSNKLRYEVTSLSKNIVNFTNKIEEQSKFKLFFKPALIDLIQTKNGRLQNLGELKIINSQGSSSSDQVKTDDVVFNKIQLQQLRQLIV